MTLSKQDLPPCRLPGIRALWGYIKESWVVEFRSNLRLLVAPLRALRAGSLEPIRSAFGSAMEDSDRLFDRYFRRPQ